MGVPRGVPRVVCDLIPERFPKRYLTSARSRPGVRGRTNEDSVSVTLAPSAPSQCRVASCARSAGFPIRLLLPSARAARCPAPARADLTRAGRLASFLVPAVMLASQVSMRARSSGTSPQGTGATERCLP